MCWQSRPQISVLYLNSDSPPAQQWVHICYTRLIAQWLFKSIHTDCVCPVPQVLVNVVDVNDNAPIFPRMFEGPFEIPEGQPGPRVWTVRATDADSGSNGKVEYSITEGDLKSVFAWRETCFCLEFVASVWSLCLLFSDEFVISSVEGELRVRRDVELDRETISYYNVTITAKDLGTPPQSATVCTHTILRKHETGVSFSHNSCGCSCTSGGCGRAGAGH